MQQNKLDNALRSTAAAGSNKSNPYYRMIMVKRLLDKGAHINAKDKDNGLTALGLAAQDINGTEMVKLLLERGAHVDTTVLACAINDRFGQNISPKEVRVIIGGGNNSPEILKLLLKNCIDLSTVINQKLNGGTTLAMMASSDWRNIEKLKLLIDNGADINASTENGTTALKIAAYNENLEAVKLLSEKSADINAKNNQETVTIK